MDVMKGSDKTVEYMAELKKQALYPTVFKLSMYVLLKT